MNDDQTKAQIQALLREREGYERAGKTERLAQVNAQLRDLGHQAKTPAKRADKL